MTGQMMVLPRLVLASDDHELQERLQGAMQGVAEVMTISPTAANLLQSLVEAKPALLLVDLNNRTPLHILVGLVRRADPSLQAVAIGDARSADAVLGAVRAGAADFLDRSEPADVLRVQVLRHFRAEADVLRAGPGAFELVLSAQAGGGDSLFAINMAVTRARDCGDMLLIDCTLPTSEAGAALDIRMPYTVADGVNDLSRLDRTLATSALAKHEESGLMVLPLATAHAPDVDNIAPDALARLVSTIRPLFKNTLLSAGGVRSPGLLLEFMQAASRIYFVCPQKFTAVADGQALLERIHPGAEVLARTTLVIDEYQAAISLTEEQMRATLGLSTAVRLPPARVELTNSLNIGRPLVLDNPRSAYVQTLARLAGVEPRGQAAAPGRMLSEAFARARSRIGAGDR